MCTDKYEQFNRGPSAIDQSNMAVHGPDVARRTKELGPDIGKRLRKARQAAGLTVRDLAAKAHTTAQTVQWISDGKGGNTGVGLLVDLAKALGVTPEWLAFGVGEGPKGKVGAGQDEEGEE